MTRGTLTISNNDDALQFTPTTDTKEQIENAIQILNWCAQDMEKQKRDQRRFHLVKRQKGIPSCRNFALLHDEADILYGNNKHGSSEREKMFNKLMNLGPRLKVNVTATPVPLLSVFDQEKDVPYETLVIEPNKDEYVGLGNFVTLKNEKGDPIFLDQEEVNANEGIPFAGGHIPSTCEKTIQLYKHALSNPTAKGILLVDISNHYVYKEDKNILEKADSGKMYFRHCVPLENRWASHICIALAVH